MKYLLLFMFLFSFKTIADECPLEFNKMEYCASVTWLDGPYLNKKSTFEVKFWKLGDASRELVTPSESIIIKTWMIMDNGHSHGGSAIHPKLIEEGHFVIDDERFFMNGMKGDWNIKIILENQEYGNDIAYSIVDLD